MNKITTKMDLKIKGRSMGKKVAMLMIMIVGLASFGSCSSDQNKFESAAEESEAVTEEVEQVEASEELDEGSDESTASLPISLRNCEAYSETFTHPFTGEEMKREVVGQDAEGLCEYKEEMPNGGLMKCKFSEKTREVMAQYYKDVVLAGPGSMSLNTSYYTIDGKTVANPLDEVMNNGDCKISGY